MKAVLQRVRGARVEIGGEVVGAIDQGLLVLVCAMQGDTPGHADRLLSKLLKLRVFADEQGRMNRCLQEVEGAGLLLVSQFTLAADTASGNRPSFKAAAPPDEARRLYDHFVLQAHAAHGRVASGRFGADMQVHLVNDGPVTLSLDV